MSKMINIIDQVERLLGCVISENKTGRIVKYNRNEYILTDNVIRILEKIRGENVMSLLEDKTYTQQELEAYARQKQLEVLVYAIHGAYIITTLGIGAEDYQDRLIKYLEQKREQLTSENKDNEK